MDVKEQYINILKFMIISKIEPEISEMEISEDDAKIDCLKQENNVHNAFSLEIQAKSWMATSIILPIKWSKLTFFTHFFLGFISWIMQRNANTTHV